MEIRTRFNIGDRVCVSKEAFDSPIWVTIDTVCTMHYMCDGRMVENIDYIADKDGDKLCFSESDVIDYKS